MKRITWLGLIAGLIVPLATIQAQTPTEAPPPAESPAPPAVSPGVAEVVRLAEANTSDDVILGYIQNSTVPFELSADQILYLRDIGLSSPVITAMLSRDSALRNQPQSPAYDQKLNPPTTQPATTPAPVQTPAAVQAPGPEPAPPQPAAAMEAPAPTYVTSPPPEVNYFYSNLSPYGTWVQLDGVGWCWQPRVVVVNRVWRPYCDSGHWVWTDAGWFWQSDYSWGWAPFHYGRWQLHERCGWVWMPDRVWGPAWVTWRSEGDHCGWAPLPPHADFDAHLGYRFNGVRVGLNFDFGLHPDHFTFIALHDFNQHDFARHRLPQSEVTRIYNHTTVINNYVVNHNTVVNQGIKVDRVAAATHTEFRQVAIRDVPAGTPAPANPRGGAKGELVVYRPQLKAPARPMNVVAQKVDDRHPVIQHTAIVAPRTERPVAGNAPASSLNRNRSSQGQAPGTYPRPTVDRPPSYPPSTRPGADQPKTTVPPANQARPAGPVGQQPSVNRQYPLQSGTPTTSDATRPAAPGQSPGAYYPKGYHQSSETRTLPSPNARPSTERGQPTASPRQDNPPDTRNKGSIGPSRKIDS